MVGEGGVGVVGVGSWGATPEPQISSLAGCGPGSGFAVLSGRTETSAQFQNCSGSPLLESNHVMSTRYTSDTPKDTYSKIILELTLHGLL